MSSSFFYKNLIPLRTARQKNGSPAFAISSNRHGSQKARHGSCTALHGSQKKLACIRYFISIATARQKRLATALIPLRTARQKKRLASFRYFVVKSKLRPLVKISLIIGSQPTESAAFFAHTVAKLRFVVLSPPWRSSLSLAQLFLRHCAPARL